MPEGPEVKIITEQLSIQLKEKDIIGIEFTDKSKFWNKAPESSKLHLTKFKKGIPGWEKIKFPIKIYNITCKGKQIFFHLRSPLCTIYLNSTLGMEGRWLNHREKHSDLWLNLGYKNGRLNVIKEKIYYDDSRHFGNLTLLNQIEYDRKLNKLGPDVLSDPNLTFDKWLSRFSLAKCQNKQICVILLNQEIISGIGNYLKSEILYRCGIKPDRLVSNISAIKLEQLRIIAIQTITESYKSNGLTIRSYLSPDGKKGKFQCQVYGKDLDPYGNEVIKTKFKDGRTTYWVKECQY